MNKDQIEGQWKIISGRVQRLWAQSIDDQTGVIKGNATEIVGILQKEFGLVKEEAEAVLARWRKEFQAQTDIEAQWERFEQVMADKWHAAKNEGEKAREHWQARVALIEADAEALAEKLRLRFALAESEADAQISTWLAEARQWLEARTRT